MSTRQKLYNAWLVSTSLKNVSRKSCTILKDGLNNTYDNSIVIRSLLSGFQWYQDTDWEAAVKRSQLAKQTAPQQRAIIGNNSQAKRSYSTVVRRHEHVDCKNEVHAEGEEATQPAKASKVPSSRLSRLFHYGSLAAGVGINVATQGITKVSRGEAPTWKSLLLSDSNIDRITEKFSRMRGAALKIGQLMSFQDENVLPRELYQVLSRVQNNAHFMPERQLIQVMKNELGNNWKDKFKRFDMRPIAAASIGEVHYAELPSGEKVVVKVQYPGVKESIDSDLNNMLLLLTASRLLPRGLFLDKTIANARTELKWECDYLREARAMEKFRNYLTDDPVFVVPKVFKELCTSSLLTMSFMEGKEITKLSSDVSNLGVRNFIAENIMRLCLKEIAVFKYMQTDPNWANFLYNEKTKKIELLDFGASRSFPDHFIANYRKLLTYATRNDRHGAFLMSKELGYLNGMESKAMIDAHVDSVMTLGEPFAGSQNSVFNFEDQTVSDRIRGNISLMVNERLCPPPEETYSLHRKFSGIYLLCTRLQAQISCAKLFDKYFAVKGL